MTFRCNNDTWINVLARLGICAIAWPSAAGQQVAVATSTATVYFYRLNEVYGAESKPPILCDGAPIGRLQTNHFILAHLPGGNHAIRSTFEADGTTMDLAAGQTYFVRLTMAHATAKHSSPTTITVVPQEQGSAEVKLLHSARVEDVGDAWGLFSMGQTPQRRYEQARGVDSPDSQMSSDGRSQRSYGGIFLGQPIGMLPFACVQGGVCEGSTNGTWVRVNAHDGMVQSFRIMFEGSKEDASPIPNVNVPLTTALREHTFRISREPLHLGLALDSNGRTTGWADLANCIFYETADDGHTLSIAYLERDSPVFDKPRRHLAADDVVARLYTGLTQPPQ